MPAIAPAAVTVTEERTATWPVWLVGIWAAVFAHRMVRIARSYVQLRGVKRRAMTWKWFVPGVTRPARVLISCEVSSPVAAGFLHPAVILPKELCAQLTDAEMTCVLLHEGAHLVRYDDWGNLAARVLGAALLLHPVAWWMLRQIEREREAACDDWVVAQTGSAQSYAESLARMVELRVEASESVLAAGIFTGHSQLHRRIEMLLRRGRVFTAAATPAAVGAGALVLFGLALAGGLAPRWIAFAQRMEFEVASVKPNTTDGPIDGFPRRSGDLLMMHNTQPYSVIYYAYRLRGNYQMVGYVRLPDGWNWYDIDARAGSGATDDQVRLMFQSLLADRFHLKVHRETREIAGFELAIAKGKPKLTPSREASMTVTIEGRTFPQRAGSCSTTMWHEGSHMICHAVTMETIANEVGNVLRAPVADRTGLAGTYDLNLLFSREDRKPDADQETAPPLGQALQTELGLKLEKGKAPVEVIVIDHMEKPSPN